MRMIPSFVFSCVLSLFAASAHAQTTSRPAIRTVTAFVQLDREHHAEQLADAQAALSLARDDLTAKGFWVQSVRITTQPFPEYVGDLPTAQAVTFLQQLDALAAAGGYGLNVGPAMRSDADDPRMMDVLAGFLATARTTNASAHVIAEKNKKQSIQFRVIAESAELIETLANNSPGSLGNFSFAITSLVDPYAPFFPASWHDGPGRRFSIGLQSASVIEEVLARTGFDPEQAKTALAAELSAHAQVVEQAALEVQQDTGWKYMGIDPAAATFGTFASVGAAMESFTGTTLGGSGTLTAAEAITSGLRAISVKQVGLRGLMLPVLEDARIAARWGEGRLHLDSLLSYSSVCGTGLDTVPLPGSISRDQLQRILTDVATLSKKWSKGLTARLLPIKGKSAGDPTTFNHPFLVDTVIQPLP